MVTKLKKRTPARKPARKRPAAKKPASPGGTPIANWSGRISTSPGAVPPTSPDMRTFLIVCAIDAWLKELPPGKEREDVLYFMCRRHFKGFGGMGVSHFVPPADMRTPPWLAHVAPYHTVGTHDQRVAEEKERQARAEMS